MGHIFRPKKIALSFIGILSICVAIVFYFGQARRNKYFSPIETLRGYAPKDRKLAPLASPQAKALDDYLFSDNETGVRKGKRTDGVILYHKGRVIYEKYSRGYDESKKHITWSVSKSIISVMYGIAHQEKRYELTDSICIFQEFSNPDFCEIHIQDVLSWSTGIQWLEEYEKSKEPEKASILAMLSGEGRRDMAAFVQNQPMQVKPGTGWRYSSGDTMLAAYVLAGIYRDQDLRLVFQEKLFQPLDMNNSLWETDPAGTIAGAYYFFTTPRDLAAVGLLLNQRGISNKSQLISAEYFKFMNTVPDAFKKNRLELKEYAIPGAHLWINHADGMNYPLSWPEAPEDTVAALGHWGQILVAIPSLDAVAVRLGDTRDGSFQRKEFVKLFQAFIRAGAK